MSAVILMGKPVLIGSATNDGARGKRNEDSYAVFAVDYGNGRTVQYLIVADGVTSTQGGGQASKIAVDQIRSLLEAGDDRPLATRMADAIQQAHQAILNVAAENPDWKGMSTTLVLAAIANDQLIVMHLGDSRAYLIRGDRAYQLTLDHTWVQEAIDEQRITPQQAETHPNRHVIQRFLGTQRSITVDQRIILPGYEHESPERRMTTEVLPLEAGDAILLCSDGLYGKIPSSQIAAQVRADINQPQRAADQLIKLALQRQEADNITVVLLTAGGEPVPLAAVPSARQRSWIVPAALGAALAVLAMGALLLLTRPAAPATAQPGAAPTAVAVAAAVTSAPVAAVAPLTPTEAAAVTATPTVVPTLAATVAPTLVATATQAEAEATPTVTLQPTATPLGAQAALPAPTDTLQASAIATDPVAGAVEAGTASPLEVSATKIAALTSGTDVPPTVLPAATPRPGAATAKPTSTPLATATPLPTDTPTSTPRPTATATPTRVSTAATEQPSISTAASTPLRPLTAANAGGPQNVTIESPPDNYSSADSVTFSWKPDQPLEEGQEFEVVFWNVEGGTRDLGKGWVRSGKATSLTIPLKDQPAGNYEWGIFLVLPDPYTRIRYLGGGRHLQIPSQSDSSASGPPGSDDTPSGGK